MTPIILYNNLFRNGTLTASSTNADSAYDVVNIIDWRSYTLWKSGSVETVTIAVELAGAAPANTIGIFNHNLGTAGATVKVQYENSGWQTALTFEPANDKSILKIFDTSSHTNWRIEISSLGAVPYIGTMYLAERLEFLWPPVIPVDPVQESIQIEGEYSRAGDFLGGLLTYNPIRVSQRFTLITRAWYDTYFKPFWNLHGKLLRPFFYAVDLEVNTDDVYFLQFDPAFVRRNPFSLKTYYDEFSIDLIGVSEE